MRIRIEIHGIHDRKYKKIYSCKTFYIFWIENWNFTYPYSSIKDAKTTGEAFSPQKRTSGTSKHEGTFFYICGSFLPSWIRIQQLKLMRIRIHNPEWGRGGLERCYPPFQRRLVGHFCPPGSGSGSSNSNICNPGGWGGEAKRRYPPSQRPDRRSCAWAPPSRRPAWPCSGSSPSARSRPLRTQE